MHKIKVKDINELFASNQLSDIKNKIKNNELLLIKNLINKKLINEIKIYLQNIMNSTIPNYYEIKYGCPNFYRINFEDKRSFIKGHFHQINFFKWNQDIFNFFEQFKFIFEINNLINDNKGNKYINTDDLEFIPKISFQFYPSGKGYLERHHDPTSDHQISIATLCMSDKGKDFISGGLEVKDNNKWVNIDDYSEVGDLIIFKASNAHGVEKIDLNKPSFDSFRGRWMALFSINKVAGSNAINNSKKA